MRVMYFNLIYVCEIDFISESTKSWLENKRRIHNRCIQMYIVDTNESDRKLSLYFFYLFPNICTHDMTGIDVQNQSSYS